MPIQSSNTAYIIGAALGDGNLSNPNGRAIRLRISCDNKYPNIIRNITNSLIKLLPDNKVTPIFHGKNCTDISCYSNNLEKIMGWKAYGGSKFVQSVRVPEWIFDKDVYMKSCLRGLFETDGSIYMDRGYKYVNFTTIVLPLAADVRMMIEQIGYSSTTQTTLPKNGKRRYIVRVCKRSQDFIRDVNIDKS